MTELTHGVSIVIPTLNSSRTLARCLESIHHQTVPPNEVIVVDDSLTTDGSRHIAQKAGAKVIVSPAGMAESRNQGFAAATSSYCLSIDSDMALSSNVVEELLRCFTTADCDAVTIPEKAVATGIWARARKLDKDAVERSGGGRSLRGFRRTVFEEVGGYDPTQEAFEDLDFHRRVVDSGATIRHIERAYIEHDEGFITLRAVIRKKYRYGFSVSAFRMRHGLEPFLIGFGHRLQSAVALGLRRDALALPTFLILKAAEYISASIGTLVHQRRTTTPHRSSIWRANPPAAS